MDEWMGVRMEGKTDAWVTQRSLSCKLEAEFRGHVIQHMLFDSTFIRPVALRLRFGKVSSIQAPFSNFREEKAYPLSPNYKKKLV